MRRRRCICRGRDPTLIMHQLRMQFARRRVFAGLDESARSFLSPRIPPLRFNPRDSGEIACIILGAVCAPVAVGYRRGCFPLQGTDAVIIRRGGDSNVARLRRYLTTAGGGPKYLGQDQRIYSHQERNGLGEMTEVGPPLTGIHTPIKTDVSKFPFPANQVRNPSVHHTAPVLFKL
ncbi:Hypp3926 [Branchiostoma lanceolatum]|uniref:Hypp3926 protein n=1 Tax=Branchiostoma lanceolatum TaxID=7740 RepID=A0A8K0A6C0_BRALA|nr:Hypp3926 [Branchiostoma lanceolatum]